MILMSTPTAKCIRIKVKTPECIPLEVIYLMSSSSHVPDTCYLSFIPADPLQMPWIGKKNSAVPWLSIYDAELKSNTAFHLSLINHNR